MNDERNNSQPGLNEFQARHLKVACQHIDKLLGEMGEVLRSAESKSVFPKYVAELSPVQRKTIEDYTSRLRGQLLRVLAGQGINPDPSRIAEAHALHTMLTFIEIALEELSPEDMAGYGTVAPEAATDLKGIVQELGATVGEMHAYVLQRGRHDIDERLHRLLGSSEFVGALETIQKVISTHGLVEFRPRLLMLLDLIENRSFEIGIFGRVSSGKSSLLNHVIGHDVLPVGVTPITAVPTLIRYGEISRLLVVRDNAPSGEFPVHELGAFVDERQNPANAKRVSRIVLELPAKSLRNGVAFVDTPGLGSLATSGSAETLAYLPRCDYGIVLVDSAGTLTYEDLRTIEALRTASIPVSVLISKADLVSEADLHGLADYVSQQVLNATGCEIPVHPISVLASHAYLVDRWLHDEIGPIHGHVNELKEQSLARKSDALITAVLASLRALRNSRRDTQLAEAVETQLRHASASIEDCRQALDALVDSVMGTLSSASGAAIGDIVAAWDEGKEIGLSVVTSALRSQVTAIANNCYSEVAALAESLQDRLADASRALHGKSDTIEHFYIRELPIFDVNVGDAKLSPPALRFFGSSITSKIATREIDKHMRPVRLAIESYSARLRSWAKAAVDEVERQYDSYAQELRMQAQRLATGSETGACEAELDSDIVALEELGGTPELRPASGM